MQLDNETMTSLLTYPGNEKKILGIDTLICAYSYNRSFLIDYKHILRAENLSWPAKSSDICLYEEPALESIDITDKLRRRGITNTPAHEKAIHVVVTKINQLVKLYNQTLSLFCMSKELRALLSRLISFGRKELLERIYDINFPPLDAHTSQDVYAFYQNLHLFFHVLSTRFFSGDNTVLTLVHQRVLLAHFDKEVYAERIRFLDYAFIDKYTHSGADAYHNFFWLILPNIMATIGIGEHRGKPNQWVVYPEDKKASFFKFWNHYRFYNEVLTINSKGNTIAVFPDISSILDLFAATRYVNKTKPMQILSRHDFVNTLETPSTSIDSKDKPPLSPSLKLIEILEQNHIDENSALYNKICSWNPRAVEKNIDVLQKANQLNFLSIEKVADFIEARYRSYSHYVHEENFFVANYILDESLKPFMPTILACSLRRTQDPTYFIDATISLLKAHCVPEHITLILQCEERGKGLSRFSFSEIYCSIITDEKKLSFLRCAGKHYDWKCYDKANIIFNFVARHLENCLDFFVYMCELNPRIDPHAFSEAFFLIEQVIKDRHRLTHLIHKLSRKIARLAHDVIMQIATTITEIIQLGHSRLLEEEYINFALNSPFHAKLIQNLIKNKISDSLAIHFLKTSDKCSLRFQPIYLDMLVKILLFLKERNIYNASMMRLILNDGLFLYTIKALRSTKLDSRHNLIAVSHLMGKNISSVFANFMDVLRTNRLLTQANLDKILEYQCEHISIWIGLSLMPQSHLSQPVLAQYFSEWDNLRDAHKIGEIYHTLTSYLPTVLITICNNYVFFRPLVVSHSNTQDSGLLVHGKDGHTRSHVHHSFSGIR